MRNASADKANHQMPPVFVGGSTSIGIVEQLVALDYVQLFSSLSSMTGAILRFINVGMSASPHFTKWRTFAILSPYGGVFPCRCLWMWVWSFHVTTVSSHLLCWCDGALSCTICDTCSCWNTSGGE